MQTLKLTILHSNYLSAFYYIEPLWIDSFLIAQLIIYRFGLLASITY